ncbi:MAG: sensor histidine kinase [Oscillospiraceae bacterium]
MTLSLLLSVAVFAALFLAMVIVGLAALIFLRYDTLPVADGATQGLRWFIAALIFASMIVGSVISGIVIRMPLGPVNALINGLNRLASGEYETRMHPAKRSEKWVYDLHIMRALSDSFNALAAELESTEMLRSDFINNFSHEFKTPIVSIAGFAKLLKRGNLTEEQKIEYLDIIEEESLRLSSMATNVLNLTKVESQSILTNVSAFNLSEQLRTCVLMMEAKWSRKRLDMELLFDEIQIRGNEELLKEVWINLLDNAVKFAAEGSSIFVRAVEAPGGVTVSVENEGPEIPASAREKIFNKFYQADESHAAEGNGVGLAIVKRVVELHGGEVGLTSEAGKTMFTVHIPQ